MQAEELMDKLSRATAKGWSGLPRLLRGRHRGGRGRDGFRRRAGRDDRPESVPLGEKIDRDDFILFSESNSRFLVEVAPENKAAFEKMMKGVVFAQSAG